MSENTQLPAIIEDHCRRLRSKEMYVDTGDEFHMSETGSGIYWCSHTQNCLGPDGQVAEPASCKAGRSCFETV